MVKLWHIVGRIQGEQNKLCVSNVVAATNEKEAYLCMMSHYGVKQFEPVVTTELELKPGMMFDFI